MMTAKGLAKLAEECGELQQVIGKRLAYFHTEVHPDGGPALSRRLEDEIADVLAACTLVVALHELDDKRINERRLEKIALFKRWHYDTTNNINGFDRG